MKSETSLTHLTKDQAALVDRVKTYHQGVYVSYEHQIQYAFMAGLTLNALKDTCEHGDFMRLRETHLPEISKSAAQRYMEFTRLAETQITTVGNLTEDRLLLTNGDLPPKEKAAVLAAVYEAADGKSWTAFYRDLNLVRDKMPAAHHPIKPMSPDEKVQAENEQAEALVRIAQGNLNLLIDDLRSKNGTLTVRIHPTLWREILSTTIEFNKLIRPLTKRKLSPDDKKQAALQKRYDKIAAKSRDVCLTDGDIPTPIKPHSSPVTD